MGVSKNNTPKSSILIGFSIINHPFWNFPPIFGNTHIFHWWTHGVFDGLQRWSWNLEVIPGLVEGGMSLIFGFFLASNILTIEPCSRGPLSPKCSLSSLPEGANSHSCFCHHLKFKHKINVMARGNIETSNKLQWWHATHCWGQDFVVSFSNRN